MLDPRPGAPTDKPPVINLIVILLMVFLGFAIVGPIIGYLLAMPFYDGEIDLLEAIGTSQFSEQIKLPLYIIQGAATVVGLILTPMVYLATRRRKLGDLFPEKHAELLPMLITVFVVITFMGINSVFIEWNANVDFPDFAKAFEEWAREREDALALLTEFLTQLNTTGELFMALVVIAIFPAIGEEIVFRGLIQNELLRGTRNAHVAIWFAAFLFSAIHFQFFGFVPRLLLGALFGYLYYWSGSLTLAIIAHFVNNGVSVVALYFYQRGAFDYDIESPESMPLNVVATSVIITVGLLYYFRKYYQDRKIAIF